MIRASGLYGRTVIDLDTAERIGDIDEIIVDPYGPGIAGYVVTCERSLFGGKKRIIIPVDAVHAIGPDAVTMRSVGSPDYHTAHLDALPRLSELTGRRLVSFGGRLLGSVEDALIDERDGRIIGYPLERPGTGTWLETVFGLGWRADRPDYVRADASLRVGARLIVVPDDAIASGNDLDETATEQPASAERPDRAEGVASTPQAETADAPAELAATARQAAVRQESAAATAPFSLDAGLISDDGLGLQRSAEADRASDDGGPSTVDPDEDTGLAVGGGEGRGRTRRRPQAEKVR